MEYDPHKCPNCGMDISTPALMFLHQEVHREGDSYSLGNLPFVMFPRVAKLMQDYADTLTPPPAGAREE